MAVERRNNQRVEFEHGYSASLMAIDATWHREHIMLDVSESGARVTVTDGTLDGLQLEEFFLVLASNGSAFRRCGVEWRKGVHMGITFLKRAEANNKNWRASLWP